MYLKSLNIHGFKSFADRTTLEFHQGVTAVVGPNGCGKSNVLDSIRWALGEQSAKALRGGEMADVIFNGSEERKPLGMAEVTLTFADCEAQLGTEWNEMAITRRVYRDGKAEYMMNGSTCRLRDIHELFMDTGIGRSAYSIMEQGKIDMILSARAEDRRAIFEEAAGITKYKLQKKDALRKLEYTEANLLRLTDLVKEVKRQLGNLQRQASKARKAKEYGDAIRVIDTHVAARQLNALVAEVAGLEASEAESKAMQGASEARLAAQDQAVGELRGRTGAVEEQVAETRQLLIERRSALNDVINRLKLNRERLEELASMGTRHEDEAGETDRQIADLLVEQERLLQIEQDLSEAQGGNALEEELRIRQRAHSEARAAREAAEHQFGNQRQGIARAESLVAALKAELQRGAQNRESSEQRLASLSDEESHINEGLAQVERERADLKDESESWEEAREEAREELQAVEAARQGARQNLQVAEKAREELRRKQADMTTRAEAMRHALEAGEGFDGGAQALVKGDAEVKTALGGPATLLAAQMSVEPDFVVAVESALAAGLQTVLCPPGCDLAGLAGLVRAKGLPGVQVTTSRLAGADNQGWQREMLPEGAVAWALDKIQAASSDAENVLQALLGNVLIMRDLPAALGLRTARPELTLVTPEGEVLSREGLLRYPSAAAKNSQHSPLRRAAELKKLEADAETLGEQFDKREDECRALANRVSEGEERQREVREREGEIQLKLNDVRNRLAHLERQMQDAQRRLQRVKWEQEEIAQARQRAGDHLDAQRTQMEDQSAFIAAETALLVEREAGLAILREAEAAANEEVLEMRARVLTAREQAQTMRNQVEQVRLRLTDLREQKRRREEDLRTTQERQAHLTAENTRLEAESQELEETREEAQARLSGFEADLSDLRRQLAEAESQLNRMRSEAGSLTERLGQYQVKSTQLQLRRENLLNLIQERYRLDLNEFVTDYEQLAASVAPFEKLFEAPLFKSSVEGEAPAPTPENLDWSALPALLGKLRERLDSLGPVNHEAIAEFEEVQDRDRFLDEQLSDLLGSKKELLEIIGQLNKTTEAMFSETFAAVRENFREMFGMLFGGGQADLQLMDSNDPLECGIDIIARPPGKKLSTVSLLSGGERTMTAVALLFSIYMVKPSPFCILDEMDAPLDESNIARFLKILDRFVGQSQFVVITHNKRTISRADVLYGVTMQERGVSRLVGVRLSNADAPAPPVGEAEEAPKASDELALS